MKLSNQQHTELMQAYEAWWKSYLTGDVTTYESWLDEDYRFIGSTDNEEFLNRKDTTAFFAATADQIANKVEVRNLNRSIEVVDKDLVLITDLFDGYVLGGSEWVFYGRFRFSSLMKERAGGWRVFYQHFSTPDAKANEGETLGVDQITKENQELRDAIKRRTADLEIQNRQLEIEAALERVRAVAMGMSRPDDMLDVCQTISDQLQLLKIESLRNVQTAIAYENKGTYSNYEYYTRHKERLITEVNYKNHPAQAELVQHMLSGSKEFLATSFTGPKVQEWLAYQKTTNQFIDSYLATATSINWYFYFIGNVAIGLSTYEPLSEEEIILFKRFRNVFGLAYRRYQDIEKADAQTRAVQIELGLERVRARAMAMQKSDELAEAAQLLYQEFGKLGINTFTCGYMFIDEETNTQTAWVVLPDGTLLPNFIVFPLTGDQILERRYQGWKNQEPLCCEEIEGEVNKAHHRFLATQVPEEIAEEIFSRIPDRIIFYTANFSVGYLLILATEHLSDEAKETIIRFARVFEMTYTRFNDLKQAEAQAKEANIEAALEKVRSRTMAMQSSEELKEVIRVVYDQFVHLKMPVEHAGFIIDYKEREDMNIWLADQHEVPSRVSIPYFDCAHWNSFREAKKKGSHFFTNLLDFEEKNRFYQQLFQLFPGVSEKAKEYYAACPGLAISTALLDNVGLYIENFSGIPFNEEENNTLQRIGKVFQQTYTRFLDLQKAEAQAREAQIEAAMEKVRSRAMAMQKPEELVEVAQLLRREMSLLGMEELETSSIYIHHEDTEKQNAGTP
jgi:hypothetical protein